MKMCFGKIQGTVPNEQMKEWAIIGQSSKNQGNTEQPSKGTITDRYVCFVPIHRPKLVLRYSSFGLPSDFCEIGLELAMSQSHSLDESCRVAGIGGLHRCRGGFSVI